MKSNNEIYGVNKKSLELIKKEYKLDEEIKEYGNKQLKGEFHNILDLNAVSLNVEHNKFLLNQYLEKHMPDFLMLNEPGKRKGDNIPLYEEYNLIDNGQFTRLIFNAKYIVHKFLTNLHDKYILICRVTLEDNEKQLILVVVYCSPNTSQLY